MGKSLKTKQWVNYVENTTSSRSTTHGVPRTPWTQGLVERRICTVKKNILNILKDRNESLGKWSTVLGEAAYKKNTTLHRAINKVLSQVVFSMLPRKRYLAEQKRITLRKESNVQPVKKKIHPLIWPLSWMIPVLKMTFWISKHRTTFCGWLTSGNFSLKPQQTKICHPWMCQRKPRKLQQENQEIKKQSGGLQNWWICFHQNKQSWQNFATTSKCTALRSHRSW